ncbi:MAG: BON domain-containing protein [Acidobacteria bacterium]|nr:BON domain-containing protein [Acidobacteriota bacterium]
MNKIKLIALAAGMALAALAAGCGGDSNVNVNANINRANANVNANAVVVNNNRAVSYNANMTREEYEKNKESYSEEAKKGGHTVGSGVNDGWLWTKVRAALLSADDLRDSTINVDVDNAVVTLRGTVANGNQKIRAVDVAKKVDGVKSVTNKLEVANAGSNANAKK